MKYCYGMLLLLLLAVAGCKEKKEDKHSHEQLIFQMETVDEKTGLQRMQVSRIKQEIVCQKKKYQLAIDRVPCDSLPQVKMEGSLYADNVITLSIRRENGGKVVSRRFTKRDFKAQLPEEFYNHAILEGMVFDEESTEDAKVITLASSVCVPMSDIYVPFSIRITDKGGVTILRNESMEEVPLPDDMKD